MPEQAGLRSARSGGGDPSRGARPEPHRSSLIGPSLIGMDPTARFVELVRAGGEPLDETVLAIAAHARDGLRISEQLDRLDALAASVRATDPAGLCAELFGAGGFAGDRARYHHPANSFLDRVLDRRRGIPITLSVLAMEVGRRRGVGLVGIGMPGHFLVREVGGDQYFDPFEGGITLDVEGCRRRFEQIQGPASVFHPDLLAPVGALDITARILANLTRAYLLGSDRSSLVWVLDLRTRLPGDHVVLHRQLAGLLAQLGRFGEAASRFELLAELQPDRAEMHRRAADRVRARLN